MLSDSATPPTLCYRGMAVVTSLVRLVPSELWGGHSVLVLDGVARVEPYQSITLDSFMFDSETPPWQGDGSTRPISGRLWPAFRTLSPAVHQQLTVTCIRANTTRSRQTRSGVSRSNRHASCLCRWRSTAQPRSADNTSRGTLTTSGRLSRRPNQDQGVSVVACLIPGRELWVQT